MGDELDMPSVLYGTDTKILGLTWKQNRRSYLIEKALL